MFLRIDLYDINPDVSMQEYVIFEQRVSEQYTRIAETRGSLYAGLYLTDYILPGPYLTMKGGNRFQLAGVYLAEGTLEQFRSKPKSTPTPEFLALLQEAEPYGHPDPDHQRVLDLSPSMWSKSKQWDLMGKSWRVHLHAPQLNGSPDSRADSIFPVGSFVWLDTGLLCDVDLISNAEPKTRMDAASYDKNSEVILLQPLVPARNILVREKMENAL